MSFWFGTTEVADTIDLSNLFLGVLGPTVQKDGPWTNSSFDRMSDPTFSRAVDDSIPSSCRRLDGDDDYQRTQLLHSGCNITIVLKQ